MLNQIKVMQQTNPKAYMDWLEWVEKVIHRELYRRLKFDHTIVV